MQFPSGFSLKPQFPSELSFLRSRTERHHGVGGICGISRKVIREILNFHRRKNGAAVLIIPFQQTQKGGFAAAIPSGEASFQSVSNVKETSSKISSGLLSYPKVKCLIRI